MNGKPKIAIIGVGNVGASYAYALSIKGLVEEISLIDENYNKALGESLDLNHGLSFIPPALIKATRYEACKDADLIVITAGARQKPGQTRLELVAKNVEIFKKIIPEILKNNPNPLILVVTNPVDILTYVTLKISKLPASRVFGSGTTLDSSRLRYLLSQHCKVDPRNVHAYILGEHGDSEFAVWSNANIAGMRFADYCQICINNKKCQQQESLEAFLKEVKDSAYKVIEYKGSTCYAVGLSLIKITQAIIRNESAVLPISTLLEDYYGINDICLSVPCKLNRQGIEQRIKINLSREEEKQLLKSAALLQDIIKQIKI